MRIRNNITGVVSNERGDIAQALVRQGFCERIPEITDPGNGPKIAPQFTVETIKGIAVSDFLAIRLRVAGRDELFADAPQVLTDSHFGRPVPENIRRAYTEQWMASPELRKFFDRITEPHPQNAQAAADLAARGGR